MTARSGDGGRTPTVLVVFVTMLALWSLVGCGGQGGGGAQQQEEQQQAAEAAVAGEFVGEAPDADAFVAVVADEPEREGADTRRIRAYLCDGRSRNVWFEGTAAGNDLDLASEGGARLEGTLAPEGATGEITLADGEHFSFEATPAEGVEGFYPVGVPAEGPLSATSWSGARLEGQRTGERITATITPSEGGAGEAVDVGISAPPVEEGDNRWIVLLSEGEQPTVKGALAGVTTTGFSGGPLERSPASGSEQPPVLQERPSAREAPAREQYRR